jgi:myo-inositol-1(or 4)-monophosphatase
MVEWESLLKEAAERVQEVRDRLVTSQKGTERVGEGAGGDTTMRVDKESEDEIIQVVKQKGDVRLVAEENGESGPKDARWTVIIDPIDGSSNFERQIPFYCTSIAVLEGKTLEDASHALVRNLISGEVYYAEAAGYATKNGEQIKSSTVTELRESVVGVDLAKSSLSLVSSLNDLTSSVRRQMHFGANALEACFLAEGRIDGFVDVRGRIRIMDMAAAYLIGRQAGVTWSDRQGRPVSPAISVKERFSIVGAGNKTLHAKMIEKLKSRK